MTAKNRAQKRKEQKKAKATLHKVILENYDASLINFWSGFFFAKYCAERGHEILPDDTATPQRCSCEYMAQYNEGRYVNPLEAVIK